MSNKRRSEGTLISYSGEFNYLLETYTSDYIITRVDAEILCFLQPWSLTATEYTTAHRYTELQCNCVHNEYAREVIFFKVFTDRFERACVYDWRRRKLLRSRNLQRMQGCLPTCNTDRNLLTRWALQTSRTAAVKTQVIRGIPSSTETTRQHPLHHGLHQLHSSS